MASNGNHQLLRQVFSLQSNGAAGDAGRRFGGQDKARIASARTATPQPAVVTASPRAKTVHPNGTRTTKGNSAKSTRVHLDLWVNPIVKTHLQRIAAQEGLSMSKAGAALLERSLQQTIDMQYHALLTPVIETTIKKEIRSFSNRIAMLLARTLFASEQTRSITTNILGRMPEINDDLLKHILVMSQKAAKSNLSRKTSPELVAAIEQWLLFPDTDEKPEN